MGTTRTTQTASHWGVYRVETDEATGEVVSTEGVSFDPHPSPIQAGLPAVVRDRLRIDQPYVRAGYLRHPTPSPAERGPGSFVPLRLGEAVGLVGEAPL